MTHEEETELRRQLKVAEYERGFLQKRLDAIRKAKETLNRLLDTPTLQEHLEAGGDVMSYISNPQEGTSERA